MLQKPIGQVKYGSFKDGIQVVLHPDRSIEEFRIGQFVKVDGQIADYVGIITNLTLNVRNMDIFIAPPDNDPSLQKALQGPFISSDLEVFPLITLEKDKSAVHSVKNIPSHFNPVTDVSQEDLDTIFSKSEGATGYPFSIGKIISMEYEAKINLNTLVERSLGVFGSTGSGKTFFTRLLLAGLIKHKVCSSLIFDFHEEYGLKGHSEEVGDVPGLAQLFSPSLVEVYKVDPGEFVRENCIQIAYSQIEPEDIKLITRELHLSEMSYETALAIKSKVGHQWIEELIQDRNETDESEFENLANTWKVHPEALKSLIRHLRILKDLKFLTKTTDDNWVQKILTSLKSGTNVVIQFNAKKHQRLSYLLISSILTRRVYHAYRDMSEKNETELSKLNRLLIVIEEAHNFLSSEVSHSTIFGEIARELRKFNVTLMIVDQIPSQIDSEVLSQLGSRVVFHLNSDQDLDSSLEGVQNKGRLKQILYSLENKGEAMIVGYCVPIPLAFKVRRYDDLFFKEMKDTFAGKSTLDPMDFFKK
jgi:DNA helicase HerA-like ATPase